MATELNADGRVRIELALRQLNADFCYHLDHNDTARLIELFTKDAEYSHGDRLSVGRDAINALLANRNDSGNRTARHLQTGLRFDITSENSATGNSVCMTFAADQKPPISTANPHLVADFVDEYEHCADDRWRISRRHIERIFADPQNKGPVGTAG
jgi:hypothetical protein